MSAVSVAARPSPAPPVGRRGPCGRSKARSRAPTLKARSHGRAARAHHSARRDRELLRERRRHPWCLLVVWRAFIKERDAPSVRPSSSQVAKNLHHDHERPAGPCRASRRSSRPYVRGGGRVGFAAQCVGRGAVSSERSRVASALHCSARTELARQRGGQTGAVVDRRAVGAWVGGSHVPCPSGSRSTSCRARSASSASATGRCRGAGAVLLVLGLGKAAMDGRSATLATARPE